jgi:hypothetical protein
MDINEFMKKNNLPSRKELYKYLVNRFGKKKIGTWNTFLLSLSRRSGQELGNKWSRVYSEILECREDALNEKLYVPNKGAINSIKACLSCVANRLPLIKNPQIEFNIRQATKHLRIILKALKGEKHGTVNNENE